MTTLITGGTSTTKQTSVIKSAAVSIILIAILIFVYKEQMIMKNNTVTPIQA